MIDGGTRVAMLHQRRDPFCQGSAEFLLSEVKSKFLSNVKRVIEPKGRTPPEFSRREDDLRDFRRHVLEKDLTLDRVPLSAAPLFSK
jgi:hypothetical protein